MRPGVERVTEFDRPGVVASAWIGHDPAWGDPFSQATIQVPRSDRKCLVGALRMGILEWCDLIVKECGGIGEWGALELFVLTHTRFAVWVPEDWWAGLPPEKIAMAKPDAVVVRAGVWLLEGPR